MPVINSFGPVIGANPEVLILGSIPGTASLDVHQYYAHPRNRFWPIMAELLDVSWDENYEQRIEQLKLFPIILWDVLKACTREGSLDSAIHPDQFEVNDIATLVKQYPTIELIAFNGATAEKYFKREVYHSLPDSRQIEMLRLPSTSPAHASLSYAQKVARWEVIKLHLEPGKLS
ncbi:MAG: DNA-deoxyinosine glycosylase [Desulfobulbaceae bacterium]|nr:DNA-deoxyinosine glycosylase [Desulfobulbaceae bacterium]